MYDDDDPDVAVADVEGVEVGVGDAPVVTTFCVALVAIFCAALADVSEDAPVVTPLTVDSIVSSVRLGLTQTLCWNFPDLFEDRDRREELEWPDW